MIRSRIKIYLSGPIEYAIDGGISWRTTAESILHEAGIDTFNPCNSSEDILNENDLTDVKEYNLLKRTIQTEPVHLAKYLKTTRDFIKLDLLELRTSHLILAHINDIPSGGTAGELTLARHLGIPVIGFCDGEISKVSGWVLGCVDHLSFRTNPYETLEGPLHRAIATAITFSRELQGQTDE